MFLFFGPKILEDDFSAARLIHSLLSNFSKLLLPRTFNMFVALNYAFSLGVWAVNSILFRINALFKCGHVFKKFKEAVDSLSPLTFPVVLSAGGLLISKPAEES